MPKALVVYFSRSGYTRKIAQEIAAKGGTDIECIRDVRDRSGIWGYLRSARDAMKKRSSAIQLPVYNPSTYDLVILGTPVWASNVSSPMRAYLGAYKEKFRHVALFCTQGGSGAPKVLHDMADVCGQKPLASLAVNDDEIKKGGYSQKLDQFLETIGLPNTARPN